MIDQLPLWAIVLLAVIVGNRAMPVVDKGQEIVGTIARKLWGAIVSAITPAK
jgi:hypothetical protein